MYKHPGVGPLRHLATVATALLLVAAASVDTHAQYGEWIRTGRPGQTMGTYCLGARVFQAQQGYTFRSRDFDDDVQRTQSTTHVLRVGLTEDFEVSGVLRVQSDRFDASTTERSGISSFQLGVRYNVTSETEQVPSIAIQTRLLLNTFDDDYGREGVGHSTIVAIGKRIAPKTAATINAIFTHNGNAPGMIPRYTTALSHMLTQQLQLYLGGYGRIDDFDFNLDGGLGYFVNRDLKFDLTYGRQGFGDFEGDPDGLESDYFVSGGVSWRVDWRE